MSKSNRWETRLNQLIFNNTPYAIGQDTIFAASSPAGTLRIRLFTASPGEALAVTSDIVNEANYTGYAAGGGGFGGVTVPRVAGAGGWTVTNDTTTNASAITFPACTGGNNTITHFAIFTDMDPQGDDEMLYYGALNPALVVSNGITPQFAPGALSITEQ